LGCLGGLATIAVAQGHARFAVRLFGIEEALRESLNMPLPPADLDEYERVIAAARNSLLSMDEAAFGQIWTEGRAMTAEQAIDFALSSSP
jgi:hypothetical protein